MTELIEILSPILAAIVGAIAALAVERYRTRARARAKYRESQSAVYIDLYRSLIDLKLAADNLWGKANVVTLGAFLLKLNLAKDEISRNALLIEENDLDELNRLIQEFSNFRIGKERLIDLLEEASEEKISNRDIRNVVETNRRTKHRYDLLIAKIERSFRGRLAA